MADSHPIVHTEHLVLRPLALTDAADVQRLAGDREIASTTGLIPHPYEDGMAEAWIESYAPEYAKGTTLRFAITLAESGELVGAMGLRIERDHHRAELGYWIGTPYWNRGFATEAARAVIAFGFESLQLHRIHANHLTRNPASGRVMEKAGMRYEGALREHVLKWGVYEDIETYGILATD